MKIFTSFLIAIIGLSILSMILSPSKSGGSNFASLIQTATSTLAKMIAIVTAPITPKPLTPEQQFNPTGTIF